VPCDDLAAALDRLVKLVRLHLVATPHQVDAIALWTAMTHVFCVFDVIPYLGVTSPEKRCGKSRVIELIRWACARPRYFVTPSEASVFRIVDSEACTLLLDEVDGLFGPKARGEHEGLRAILNAGYEDGATVPRCIGPGNELRVFRVFCPKAFVGIGELPDTLADRSVVIALRRKRRDEKVHRLRHRDVRVEAIGIGDELSAWGQQFGTKGSIPIEGLDSLFEDEGPLAALDDRAADTWEPLIAIARLAGDDWFRRSLDVARAVAAERSDDSHEQSLSLRLLRDVREVFRANGDPPVLATGSLLSNLHGDEEADWNDIFGRPLTASRLARWLRPYRLGPRQGRSSDGQKVRGYWLVDVVEQADRYIPPASVEETGTSGTAGTTNLATEVVVPAVPLVPAARAPAPELALPTVGTSPEIASRFAEKIAAGRSASEAASDVGLDPRRIPVALARYAPEILDGIPHNLANEWEREGRVPPGTAALVAERQSHRSSAPDAGGRTA
jgi:uncharacterized protein DUF3631